MKRNRCHGEFDFFLFCCSRGFECRQSSEWTHQCFRFFSLSLIPCSNVINQREVSASLCKLIFLLPFIHFGVLDHWLKKIVEFSFGATFAESIYDSRSTLVLFCYFWQFSGQFGAPATRALSVCLSSSSSSEDANCINDYHYYHFSLLPIVNNVQLLNFKF